MAHTEIKNYTLNFGPSHPSAHGVLRLVLELDGETIDRADPHIGLLHRGTEKLIENKTYQQATPYFDRLDYVCPQNQEYTFVLAMEKLAGIDVPERGQYLRVLFAEIGRIENHVFNLCTFAMDVGAMTPMLWGFEEREYIMEFMERVSGARLHVNYYRAGGVAFDAPPDLLADIRTWINGRFMKFLEDLQTLLTDNRIFKQRTVEIGCATPEEAMDWGFSGPNLRAAGVAWDIRKATPYDVYDRMDFDIPIGKKGDGYDRYLVRLMEVYESIKIVNQCLDEMPGGPWKTEDPRFGAPRRSDMKRSMESLIQHFKLYTEGFHVPAGETYTATETPKGELGVYLVADGTNRPYRCKIRTPGYAHLQGIDFLSRGHLLADVVCNIGALDIVFGEVDR